MRKTLYLIVTAAVLVALFFLFAPQKTQKTRDSQMPTAPGGNAALVATTAGASAAATQPAAADNATLVELKVQQGRLVLGPEVIKLTEGDKLTLRVTSDTDDEMHLHGYNLRLDLTAGQTGELTVTANRSGRFEYELHHAHRTLGALEVYPR
jgi:plastocyanin